MNVIEAIKARHSTRAFLDEPIPRHILDSILEVSRFAPSGKNTQPWQVAVVQGEIKDKISQAMLNRYEKGTPSNQDYAYYPTDKEKILQPYIDRQFACGIALYRALKIDRSDKVARISQWVKNYRGFDAPVILFFFIDAFLEKGSWLDYGMFLENIMLAAVEYDLATCPQAALAEYPDIVREHLGTRYQDKILICGMALGYPDKKAPVNNYRTERAPLDEWVQWYE